MKKPSIFMQRRGLLFIICGLTATMIFCAGYVLAGLWLGAAFSLLLGLAWIAAWKQAQSNLPSLCLIAYACLGGGGILSGVPTALMISGTVMFSFASWSGFTQIRMAYWPAPKTVTWEIPGTWLRASLKLM